jgi:hypothetical protein
LEKKLEQTLKSMTQLKKKYSPFLQDIEDEFQFNIEQMTPVSEQKQEEMAKTFIQEFKAEKNSAAPGLNELNELAETYIQLLLTVTEDEKELGKLNAEKTATDNKLAALHARRIGFIFNQKLAEQVPAANYTKGEKIKGKWTVKIEEGTTDNFGNLLIKGKTYIPAILSISTKPETELAAYTNAWTGYENSPKIIVS